MRTAPLSVLLFAASQSFSSAFVLNHKAVTSSAAKWRPLAAEALQDAVQDAYAYFSQLPPEQVQSDLMQRAEWYELEPFPSEIMVTPSMSVEGCSSRVSIQTGLFQENGDWVMYRFQGETDATALRGLLQILSDITQEVPISEVMNVSPYEIAKVLGLQSALNQNQSNEMSAIWNALQQQIQKNRFGSSQSNSNSYDENEPSTMGTSIPGAGSAKPAVKSGWKPGGSSSGSTQSNASGSAPPFAIWDPTSASTQQQSPAPSPPSSSASDRLSRLDRLNSPSNSPKFADGAEVDASANKAPWDNWTPPQQQHSGNTQSSSSSRPSTMGFSVSGPSPSPPSSSSSPSDRLSRLDRLSSPSTPNFADGAEVDASASKAPWDNWTPPPQNTGSTQSNSSEAPSTLGTSIPGAGSSTPAVEKGWGPGSSSSSSGQSNTSGSAPPFASWDPTSASSQSSPAPSPPSSSPSDRLSRLDRLNSPSTSQFADGAEVDASASKAPWDNWTPPPQTQNPGNAQSTSSSRVDASNSGTDRSSRRDRVSSPSAPKDASANTWNQSPTADTSASGTSSAYAYAKSTGDSTTPLGPAFGIETAPKSPWKAEPSPSNFKPLTSSERPPWETGAARTPQSSLNPLSGNASTQRWKEPSVPNDILQPQEVTSSSFRASSSGSTGNFVQNSKKVYDSIPKSDKASASSLGPDFIESDRYKIKVPAEPSRSAPSNPWRQTTPSSPVGGSRTGQVKPNSPNVPSGWKTSDGIDPLPFTPKNLQTPGVSASSNPFSPAGVGPQSTVSTTPWTGSTPSTAGNTRVTLQPQNFSPTTGTMSSWTGSTPNSRSPQIGRESWEPSAFPTKLGDFTTEVNRKPRDSAWNQRDGRPRGSTERDMYQGRSERPFPNEPFRPNPFDADIGMGRQSRPGTERERSGVPRPRENQRDSRNGAPFDPSFDRNVGQSSQPGPKRSKAEEPWAYRGAGNNPPPPFEDREKPSRDRPRTYLDIVTGNYEREAGYSKPGTARDQDIPSSPFRGSPPGSASKSATRAPPGYNNDPRGPPTAGAPFRGAGQGPRDSNEPGYESRRSPFDENVPRSKSENYRSPPRRPDQKPYVDRIIPTRPYSNEGPMYPPPPQQPLYDAARMGDERWQRRDSRIPPPGPPGPSDYYEYRGDGPRRPGDERYDYRGDNGWRSPGQGPGPGNGRYDDPMRPRDMMPPRN